jgi:hypothetical protein
MKKQTQFRKVNIRAKSCHGKRLSQITPKGQTEKTNPISTPKCHCAQRSDKAISTAQVPNAHESEKTNKPNLRPQSAPPHRSVGNSPQIQRSDNVKNGIDKNKTLSSDR